MGFSKKFVTHPNPRSVKSIHEHIKGVHDLFINAGFTQSGDVGQYNFDVEPSFDYSVFLSTTSVGTTYNYGRLVYEFPDYYDDDGNDFKLKIIIVFELIKNTAYSNDNIDNVSINFFHNICITDSTNGESLTANSNMGQYRHGYYLPSLTNDTTRKSYPHTHKTLCIQLYHIIRQLKQYI